jgi:hypothetical protein
LKGPVIVHDPNNPMEQVQAIIQQRNQKLMGGSLLPEGWEAATDPSSMGRVYYFHRASGERSWDKPKVGNNSSDTDILPDGWKSAIDQSSGKTYYYHTNGQTRWEKP